MDPFEGAPLADGTPRQFMLITGPWQTYLSEPPEIYSLRTVSSDIDEMLNREQSLVKRVLESNAAITDTSDYSALKDRLDSLKSEIPGATTSKGHVKRSSSYRRSYVSSSGTIYQNSYPYYYSYTVFREKEKSSAPELVRSVQSVAGNATLKDLDQRIDALQQLSAKWKRRNSMMSANGTEGIMRDANEAYVVGLDAFTKDLIELRMDLRKIEQAQANKEQQKASLMQQWQLFEQQQLPILKHYFEGSKLATLSPEAGNQYQIPSEYLHGRLILACQIGPRTLFFEIEGRHEDHPFVLADVTPQIQ